MTIIAFIPEEMTVTYSWATDVLKAESGREMQRVALRKYPLTSLSIRYLLADDDALRTLRDALFLDPAGAAEVPFRPEGLYVTANVTTTEVRVPISGSQDWAIVGRRIYVERDEGEDGYGTLITGRSTSGSDYVLTVDASPPSTYLATVTRACPLLTLYPDDGPGLGNYRISGGEYVLTGRVDLFADMGLDLTVQQYDGRMVVDVPPIQVQSPLSEEYEGGAVSIEGVPFQSVTYRAFADIIRSLTFTGGPDVAPFDWLAWKTRLATMRGQQNAFLLPTWRKDLVYVSIPAADQLQVEDTHDFASWFTSSAHKWVQLLWDTGDVSYHRVTAVAPSGGTLILTFSENVTVLGTILNVSFLELVRLASDDVTVTFYSGGEFEVGLQVRTVQQWAYGAWPTTPDIMRAAMGGFGVWSSAWQCDEASGSLADTFGGGVTLSPVSSPTYGNAGPLSLDKAVGFDDGSTDSFNAASSATYDLTATTSIALYLCIKPTAMANRNFFGKAVGTDGYAIQGESAKMQAFVGDGTSFVLPSINVDHVGDWRDVLLCVDRVNQRAQLFTSLGTSTALDISAIGSPNNAGLFTLGAFTNMFGSTVAFAAVANGDIANLRLNGAEAIAAIRAFTGRA